jgi:RNA-directed DNA polymerase
MLKDAPLNSGAAPDQALGLGRRVSGMQAKLHRWAAADPGRRFDDLFNLVCDPATLLVAFERVAGNRGARTAGVDGLTVADVEREMGFPGFLDQVRRTLKAGEFRPLPVRERAIPKPGGSGKVRKLGIPTVTDRVVQAALKLVLEPMFEADFEPVSYGFRPLRRAHDAIAEIHYYGTHGYRWVLDADIEACFDSIDHTALLDRVRRRVKDKRVLGLVKAFCKAGVLTETGQNQATMTGTPQGGILSPLLANIALTALDEHVMAPWKPGGTMSTRGRRRTGAVTVDRTGGSCAMRTTSLCWSTAPVTAPTATSPGCARRSPTRSDLWVCGSHQPKPGSCTCRKGSTSSGSASSGAASEDRTAGTSTPSSPTDQCGS